MRGYLIAGNWKMYKDLAGTVELLNDLKDRSSSFRAGVAVVVCPPFTSLAIASNLLKGSSIKLGAQNMSEQDEGAYTGEISWTMLKATGCEYVILGHSERRQYFSESNELINAKAKKALAGGLRPILCVGETLEQREKGVTEQIIAAQVKGALSGISADDVARVTLAYEPVWAIGTGRNATPVQAQQVHQEIRKLIGRLYSWSVAEAIMIQYGGSVKPENAKDLLAQDDIDGALVGGACLKAESFALIINAAGQ
jgi:triosephosphate isomerase